MGSISSNYNKLEQDFMNNVTQKTQMKCSNSVKASANDNIVIIDGSKIGGDVTGVTNQVSTDASCLMTATMDNNIENILNSLSKQKFKSQNDLFNGFQWGISTNISDVKQSITNNISQILNSTCSNDTESSANNNYVYLKDSTVKGNFVGVTNKTNSSFNCAMTNMMKNATYNKAHADNNQVIKTKGVMATAMAVIAIIIVCGMLCFLLVMYFMLKNPKAVTDIVDKVSTSAQKITKNVDVDAIAGIL